MKQEVKSAPMARESSFVNLLSGWVQQGVENFFATQRILVDLAMRQNGTVIDVLREKLTAPDFQPVAMATLLFRHLLKQLCRVRVAFLQVLGEGHVDAAVLFLRGDRHRQHLALGQVAEVLHREGPYRI